MRVPEREAEVLADVDVVVAGGGPAGLGAAIAAARLGARVALCERYGLPYVSGPLPKQYGQVVRKIIRMSVPV